MANRFLNNIRINDAYTFPASDGNDGQVITTDGAGNLGFENISPDAASVIYRDNFTGDGSTVAFDLQNSITDEDQTQIYIDGVYQEKSTYSISGTTITFTTAPILGHSVEVISISSINTGPTVLYQDNFTGNGSDTAFTLGQAIDNEIKTFIFLNGVYQFKNTYTVDGTTLTFDAAPANGVAIEVVSIASAVQSDSLEAGSIIIPVKNTHTASISKGTPVYITGNVGASERLQIAPADASNSAKMPAAGLLLTTLAVNAEGYAITGGYLRNITTDTIDGTSTASNDTVYVKAGGGLTMTKPTGSNLIQNIAKIARSSGGNSGSLLVSSILRTNDIPNIANDHFWLGNSSSVATATSFPTEVGNYLTTNSYATENYVDTEVAGLVASAPATLDTLNELAAALGDDANFSTTVTNSIATKLPLAGGTLTGGLTGTTANFSGNVTIGTGIIKTNIGGDIAITQGVIGLRINDAASAISPTTATANNDNAVDLGVSNIRFRNLYMGGTGTFGGNISGARGFFNSGSTNVVATFTSTDGTATLQCADPTGNVEFGASGNNFVVQPAGGVAQLTVGSSTSTFAGEIRTSNRLAIKETNFGYSSSYKVIQVGESAAEKSISLGYDPSGNTSGSFSGNEILIPNNIRILAPAANNSGYYGLMMLNSSNKVLLGASNYLIESNYIMALDTATKNVGIGTTSPSSDISGSVTMLEINDATNNNLASLALKAGTQGSKWEMAALSSNALGFFDDGTERMRINSGGNINILNPTATTSKHIGITNAAGTTGWTFGNGILSNTHQFVIYDNTAGSARMLINSSGNVGIGTADPDHKLEVVGGLALRNSNSRLYFGTNNGPDRRALEGDVNGTLLQIGEGYTNIALQGNVGINTTSPSNKIHAVAASAISDESILRLSGGTTGFNGANEADVEHSIIFDACAYSVSSGIVQREAAKIAIEKDGSWNEADVGTGTRASLTFSTNNGTIASPDLSERMRILYSGETRFGWNSGVYTNPQTIAQFGNTVVADEYGASISSSGNALAGYFGSNAHWANNSFSKPNSNRSAGYLQIINTTINNAGSEFNFNTVLDGGTTHYTRLKITSSGTIKAPHLNGYSPTNADLRYDTSDGEIYYQSSSIRYKTDIVNLESSLDKINTLRPVRYNDIKTGQPACGLIAEETADIIPEVIFKKEIDGFDEPQIEGINYSDIVPFLIKAIQELKADNDSLKARIETLENN